MVELVSLEKILEGARPIERFLTCGVYFLIRDGRVVYVGQSRDVYSRISFHARQGEKEFDSFTILRCPAELLEEVEATYIIKLRPTYNVSLSGVTGYRSALWLKRTYGIFKNDLKKAEVRAKLNPLELNGTIYYHIGEIAQCFDLKSRAAQVALANEERQRERDGRLEEEVCGDY